MAPALYATEPDPACRTLAPAAFRVATAMGLDLMPWQRDALRLALTVDESGTGWRYPQVIVTTPRRAGKTTTTLVLNVHRGLAFPNSRAWYTAQTGQDARDFYRESVAQIARGPLAGAMLKPRMAAGSEMVRWRNGSTFRPFSPQPDALHGKDTDVVTVDESWSYAMERATELVQAISPTQLTRPWRQLIYPSTAGTEASEWFRNLVQRGRESVNDPTSRTAFIEYGTPAGMDPCDPASWPYSHPAFGITVTRDALHDELERMGPADFGRAYGNRWPDIASAGQWPEGSWQAAADPHASPAAPLVLGIDVAMDRSRASIAVVGVTDTGLLAGEMIDASRPGLQWLVPRAAQLARDHGARIVINPAGPGVTLPAALESAGAKCEELDGPAYAAACAATFDAIVERRAVIRPNRALDDAQAAAGRRPMGDRWAWSRRTSVDVSPLTALTLAFAGHLELKPPDKKPAPRWHISA